MQTSTIRESAQFSQRIDIHRRGPDERQRHRGRLAALGGASMLNPLPAHHYPVMSSKNPPLSPEDRALFRASVGPVTPVHSDRVSATARRPTPRPRFALADERAALQDALSDLFEPWEMDTGEELGFARPGLQHQLLRKLRRGQFSVGAELDLHGMNVPIARQAVSEFLHQCRLRHLRCVRIIHGKGRGSRNQGPVLKGKVDGWLRQRDEVLAFATARPVDGGTGAVYVLLKRL